ncbi:MAG: hypothetical protein V2A79_14790 [Planctomycetota bacterium]
MSGSPRLVLPISTDGTTEVCCPECDSTYCHPVAVEVNPAGTYPGSLTVNHSGISLDKSKKPVGRGVTIELSFFCEECGGIFRVNFHFHKGTTWTTVTEVPASQVGQEPYVIWRD